MSQIIFKINGITHRVNGEYGPEVTLNEYIRNVAELRGTKSMCLEGGCGACIVAVQASLPPDHEMKVFSVNSCLVSVLSCHGWEITTVEGLGNRTMGYHEIQTRLAKFNGTQCGYCTPGWIMNMYSIYESRNKEMTSSEIENSFASNICRCTGYRPIADAFKSFAMDANKEALDKIVDLEDLGLFKECGVKCNSVCPHKIKSQPNKDSEWCILNNDDNKDMIVIDCGTHKWFKVYKLEDVFKAMENGDYKFISGNTGQGVYHVKEYPANVIDISSVSELKDIVLDVNLVLGAGVTLTEMMEQLLKVSETNDEFFYLKSFVDHLDLVAHVPVRNIGTIGGNLFLKYSNKEFPSDIFLLFETVGAVIAIGDKNNQKLLMTLLEYLAMDMNEKIIISVSLPPLSRNNLIKTYKIMPRSQNAHAIVNSGFLFEINDETSFITKARIVFGNISSNFVHAYKTEKFLEGKDLYDNKTLKLALETLDEEITPDEIPAEPSVAYRKMLAIALFYKAVLCLCPDDKIDQKYRTGGECMKRNTSKGAQMFDTDNTVWPLNQPVPKLESLVQCSGEATFANDLPGQVNELYGAFVTADVNPGSIIEEIDSSEALKIPGVVNFYSAKDIPGENTFTPNKISMMAANEEILCERVVKFFGQPVGIIVADKEKNALKAAVLVNIKYTTSTDRPLMTIPDVLASPEKENRVHTDRTIEATDKGSNVKSIIYGEFSIHGQYHFYMEPQTCVVVPSEDGLDVYSSTQWLDLTNVAIANCLNINVNSVNVIVRRVGGGYGGKISRATQIACAAALVSHLEGKPCRFVLPLQTNMKIIGKRLPTTCQFEVEVSSDGEIQSLKITIHQDNGHSFNESLAYLTVGHFFNCYDGNRWNVEGNSVLTDLPSNTYCRAPCSTEGVAMIEYIMERIAFTLNKDPLNVRMLNMTKIDNPLPEMIEQLQNECNYLERKSEVQTFNEKNRWRKRSLKMIPLAHEIFYVANYNSLVSIYHADGSVSITHGGIEMGQGLNTKAAQVCAYVLGITLDKICVKPSSSTTSPNSMVTGGSIGSECIALATMRACTILTKRLEPIKKEMAGASWEDIVKKAFETGIDLQASYFTKVEEDVKPYKVFAVCALEVEVDILTGNHDVRRVDLLEDTGRSLSPEIDVGQIEGAFVMGLGYWTSEKLIYDETNGKLLTDRTWTYKPPGIKDIPADMRVYFRRNGSNEFGVLQSKATGEPALCLAVVVTHAISEAVRSARLNAGYEDQWIDIANPCTAENIFQAVGHKLEHFTLK